jgi:CRP-like cAMP-binding protein
MIEKIWTVQESGLLLRLGQTELARMEYQSRARSLPADSLFPFPENAKDSAFAVISGRLLARYFCNSRSQPITVELTPGDFFGTTSGIDPAVVGDGLELAERSTIVAVPRDVLQNSLNTQQRLQNRVLAFAGWSPLRYSTPVADNFFVSTQKRLARFLYDEVTKSSNVINVLLRGLTNVQLARLINSDVELVGGCLADWERAEIVLRRGNDIEVLDLGSLAESVNLELREPIHTNGNTVRVVR